MCHFRDVCQRESEASGSPQGTDRRYHQCWCCQCYSRRDTTARHGSSSARAAPTLVDPNEAEKEVHRLQGHAVFRSWCRHCVRGRGCEAAHSSSSSSSPGTAISTSTSRPTHPSIVPLQRPANRLPPSGARFEEGYYLGFADGTSESYILTTTGVVKSRTLRRRPLSEQWDAKLLEIDGISVLQPNGVHPGETHIGIRALVRCEPVLGEPPLFAEPPDRSARRTQLVRSDFRTHGFTLGCPGCDIISSGSGSEARHNKAGRERMEAILITTEEGQRRLEQASERINQYHERMSERLVKRGRTENNAQETSNTSIPDTSIPDRDVPVADVPVAPTLGNNVAPGSVVLDSTAASSAASTNVLMERATAPKRKRSGDDDDDVAAMGEISVPPAIAPPSLESGGSHPSNKRTAEVTTEELDDGMTDMLLIHSGESHVRGQGAVCEVYSPPRVATHAAAQGMGPGWSLDLTTVDSQGRIWDFDDECCRQRARDLVHKTRPLLLIGSPMCTYFSTLQNLHKGRVSSKEFQREFKRACRHLAFVFELYELQVQGGRYFLHEHPASASSWKQKVVVDFIARHLELYAVTSHMCQFGMFAKGEQGDGPVLKPTRWLTNSPCIASALDVKCPRDHDHVHLVSNRAKGAAIYPPALCRAIIKGFAEQLKVDSVQDADTKKRDAPAFSLDILQVDSDDTGAVPAEDPDDLEDWTASDDVRGGVLPVAEVKRARQREVQYLKDRKVYAYSTWREALRKTGKRPLRLKWIDTNKGDTQNFNVRSRLVCTEIRRKGTESIFSATPPLETLRALISKAASEDPKGVSDPLKILLIDVSRAHFYADATRDVYIELPAEDPRSQDGVSCGKLLKTMYGTLDAAEHWAEHYAGVLRDAGFRQGKASPCHFYHAAHDVWILVHGDDFFCVGRKAGLQHVHKTLAAEYELKIQTIGPQPGDDKSMKVLGRIIIYTSGGIECEADPAGHLEVVEALGMSTAKPVTTTGIRDSPPDGLTAKELQLRRLLPSTPEDMPEFELLSGDQLQQYQSLAAKLNYYSLDRPDVQFAVKELMRKLSRPDAEDWGNLKRTTRYLLGAQRAVASYPWQTLDKVLTVYTDSDHAGCPYTRKSTMGGLIAWGRHFLKGWSRTMSILALSSGEAELGAVTKACAEALGLQALLSDFDTDVKLEVHSDATAAIGICKRNGLGRVRHLAVADLWVQQRVKLGHVRLFKLPGTQNPSDVLTKYRSRSGTFELLSKIGFTLADGRPGIAPTRTAFVVGTRLESE